MVAFGIGGIVAAILAIIFGILVLVFPKFLRYCVGIYLIIVGVLALLIKLIPGLL